MRDAAETAMLKENCLLEDMNSKANANMPCERSMLAQSAIKSTLLKSGTGWQPFRDESRRRLLPKHLLGTIPQVFEL
jgi:hypothetical protein